MWTFTIRSGFVRDEMGVIVGRGYAGQPPYKNDPGAQALHDKGPLPVGDYTIGAPFDSPGHLGPFVLALTPDDDTKMHGRSDFYIHDDSPKHPGFASHGCIVASFPIRTMVWGGEQGDHRLRVVAEDLTT